MMRYPPPMVIPSGSNAVAGSGGEQEENTGQLREAQSACRIPANETLDVAGKGTDA